MNCIEKFFMYDKNDKYIDHGPHNKRVVAVILITPIIMGIIFSHFFVPYSLF